MCAFVQNNTDCLGYVFDTSDSKCYLKEDAASEHVPSPSSVSGPKECPCAPCACVEEDVDYLGGDIRIPLGRGGVDAGLQGVVSAENT